MADQLLALEIQKQKIAAQKAIDDATKGVVLSSMGLGVFFLGFIVYDYFYFTQNWGTEYPYLAGMSFILVGSWVCFLFLLILSCKRKKAAKDVLESLRKVDLL